MHEVAENRRAGAGLELDYSQGQAKLGKGAASRVNGGTTMCLDRDEEQRYLKFVPNATRSQQWALVQQAWYLGRAQMRKQACRETQLMQNIIGALWVERQDARGRGAYWFNKYFGCRRELGVEAL